jgi:hypothetical protein
MGGPAISIPRAHGKAGSDREAKGPAPHVPIWDRRDLAVIIIHADGASLDHFLTSSPFPPGMLMARRFYAVT